MLVKPQLTNKEDEEEMILELKYQKQQRHPSNFTSMFAQERAQVSPVWVWDE